jgi:PiT family inorganic phosphate transporter
VVPAQRIRVEPAGRVRNYADGSAPGERHDASMEPDLVVAVALAIGFAFTNGVHDASNAIATLVTTRAARPREAAALAAVCNLAGPLLAGAAVADTIGGLVDAGPDAAIGVIGAGLAAAVAWNAATWALGLPSSSGHALVGGLAGAALLEGGADAIHWTGGAGGGLGLIAVLIALALSPPLGALAALGATRALRRGGRRLTRRSRGSVRALQWVGAAALAFGHGANDASKSVGVIAALLLADGRADRLAAPLWATLGCALALTAGTALGGWRIVRTVGRGIYPVRSLDAVGAQGASAGVLLGATALGAPISTTQVVASSIVGAGGGHARWRHVRWPLVGQILLAWLVTLPVTAALACGALVAWRWVG